MTKKTTQTKAELAIAALGEENSHDTRLERASLSDTRNKLFEKFYHNIRVLTATESISMVDLSRKLSLKSGARLYDLCYGRGTPSTEELIVLSKHFKCTIDNLLNEKAKITWQSS